MKKKDFKNISMNGRLAYQLMCAESYFLSKYPANTVKNLFKLLWQGTSGMYWDSLSGYIAELNKECFLEYDTYEEQKWLNMTKGQYESFKEMVIAFDEDDERMLETIKDQAEVYAYSVIPEDTSESIDIVFETLAILKEKGIKEPTIDPILDFTINKRNGWGEHFDGTKLSIILNKQ